MTAPPRKPALFIGSSTEGLDVAFAVQELLEFDCDPTVWTQNVFQPGSTAMADLVRQAANADFAVMVFTPDDLIVMRDSSTPTPRDNVVFELGLFIGALGGSRCFYLRPRDGKPLRLPTDLLGIEPLSSSGARDDGNIVAALGPAANRLRRVMATQGLRELAPAPAPPAAPAPSLDQFISRWDGPEFAATRARLRTGVVLHAIEDDAGDDVKAMQHAFSFFEALASGVLTGGIEEDAARRRFGAALNSFWQIAFHFLAPLNAADAWWEPLPAMAVLANRWG